MRNDFSGVSFAPLVKSCPSTVQSLVLHGFGWSAYREESVALSVHALSLLENYLPALTTLELGHSVVTPGEDITCLSKLKSLGFWKSTILVNDELEVSLLTNLTLLNLSKARCIWENILAPILDTFIAWPALQILKADGCNLFGRRTNMDLTTVLEVHVDHFYGVTEPGLPGQQSYVHTAVSPGSPLQAAPPLLPLTPGQLLREGVSKCKSIVGLVVDLYIQNTLHRLPELEPLFCPSAELCCIKSLDLINKYSTVTRSLTFLGDGFATLVNLSIAGLHPSKHVLDLQPLCCLTSLNVSNVDHAAPVLSIKLPFKLEVFKFTGVSLFLHSTEHNLDMLPCLTKLLLWLPKALGPGAMPGYVEQDWHIPQLPTSLRHFSVQDVGERFRCRDFDWSGLQRCPYLEHLTVSCLPLSGQLTEWVRSARYLCVVDHACHWDAFARTTTSAVIDRVP